MWDVRFEMCNARWPMINGCGRIALLLKKENYSQNTVSFEPIISRSRINDFIAAGKPLPQDEAP